MIVKISVNFTFSLSSYLWWFARDPSHSPRMTAPLSALPGRSPCALGFPRWIAAGRAERRNSSLFPSFLSDVIVFVCTIECCGALAANSDDFHPNFLSVFAARWFLGLSSLNPSLVVISCVYISSVFIHSENINIYPVCIRRGIDFVCGAGKTLKFVWYFNPFGESLVTFQ